MATHCALHHRTSYHYAKAISLGAQVIRLRPAPHSRTPILSYSLKVEPAGHFLNWQQDPQGNFLARVVFPEPVKDFSIEVDLVADMSPINPFDFFLEEEASTVPFDYEESLTQELAAFRRLDSPEPSEAMAALLEECRPQEDEETNLYLVRVNQLLEKRIDYTIRMEPGVQSPEETLEKGTGSCRDTSWLLVEILRRLGFAARFVSGYLIQLKPDIEALDGPVGSAEDFTDLHAWTEVYLPGAGWVGMDPTSGLMAGEGHIPVAAAPEPTSAAPVSGTVGEEVETEFDFDMRLERVFETARVTKPYTPEQWEEIDALGDVVENRLRAGGVRMTMGGEPTFVSIDDMDGEEWETAAMGPTKRGLGDALLRRMTKRFGPGAFLHHGQGKWYPGEQLPRWAFSAHWRRDGVPVWANPQLIAEDDRDYGHNTGDSEAFVRLLSEKLDVGDRGILPAYEDAWYYLWRERRLPTNVDPHASKLDDEMERARLTRIFEQGLDAKVGHLLPLGRTPDGTRWQSGKWFVRPERLYLMPGDSPMGFRLPIDSLPHTDDDGLIAAAPDDPTAPRPALPPGRLREGWQDPASGQYHVYRHGLPVRHQPRPKHPPEEGEQSHARPAADAPDPDGAFARTALCIEPRDGKLHIFMPPLRMIEDYLELVTAIEDTAAELAMPVQLEGYSPPRDPRMNSFSVTPDPGVIEVNVHPANNWKELKAITRGLYEDARQTRLGAEKFRVDGTHTGTGGGNHIVVGAARPLDSPFLRRPDLLRSMVSYWHNHPSLSYLFSGGFVGPTSQAPRVDEARADAAYELELAFSQLPTRDLAEGTPPWVADRVLRNLLVDLTGNTHRAEFCMDKLYSPDGATGRLGLLELRGFEMPPHADMSLAQQLLVRAMISRFWDQPYTAPLVDWGKGLHDRFMLPHFIWDDFTDVCGEMTRADLPFDTAWFEPHFEFRFPQIGEISPAGAWIELRTAIEPWNVLGEEQSSAGTARYVDSSVERLQVYGRGLVEGRHVIACNGRRLPLHPTGRPGEFVAGLRYRAWAPPSALHPTIPIHAPLTFDLLDGWNERSLGGCQYHVTDPGGRAHEDYPVNSYSAESRRRTRFIPFGHSPGKTVPPTEIRSRQFPLTLDLQSPIGLGE